MDETRHVFLAGNALPGRFLGARSNSRACNSFVVGELGFGTGLNLAVLLDSIRAGLEESFPGRTPEAEADQDLPILQFLTVEKYPLDPGACLAALASQTQDADLLDFMASLHRSLTGQLVPGWNNHEVSFCWGSPGPREVRPGIRLEFRLWYGDVLDYLESMQAGQGKDFVDAWFLDGHDPAANPEMWNTRVFQGLAAVSQAGHTTFATYTAAGVVKSGLRAAGFHVVRKTGFGKKRHMIQGHYAPM